MLIYIKRGYRGSHVYDIQQTLNALAVGDYSGTGLYMGSSFSLPVLVEDGIFGKATKARVEEFQTFHGLQVDGIVGPMTWARLMGNSMPMPVIVEAREKDAKDHTGSGEPLCQVQCAAVFTKTSVRWKPVSPGKSVSG